MAAQILVRRVSSLFVTAPILVLVGLVLFPALLYGQQDLALLSLLVFGLMGALRIWGALSLFRIVCEPTLGQRRVFAGERLSFTVHVENRKVLPAWAEVRIPLQGLKGSTKEETLSGESGLLWYQETAFSWEVLSPARGVHRIGPVHVTSADLLGFFPREKVGSEAYEVISYPRLVPLASYSPARRDFFGAPGNESPVKDPVYILGTTDYHHGRPARYIHWKASARHHKMQEKLFEASQLEKVLFIVDVESFSGEHALEPFERTMEVVASMAVLSDRKGCAMGFVTNGMLTGEGRPFLRVARNDSQLTGILETLARLRPEKRVEMGDLISGLRLPSGVSAICFGFEESRSVLIVRERLKRLSIPVRLFLWEDICRLSGANLPGVGEGSGNGNGKALEEKAV